MSNKNSRKGFTTVELIIVIAVIATLSAVLIPSFAGLINNANKTAALSEARQIYTEYVQAENLKGSSDTYYIKTSGNYYFKVDAGKLSSKPYTEKLTCGDNILLVPTGTVTNYTYEPGAAHTKANVEGDGNCSICGTTGTHSHCTTCSKKIG
jgi:prepilin-type N-terminal cleavage/methylation domain-containing protein